MNRIKVKVCGMKHKDNIQELLELQPDLIGFIFYPKSKRYVGEKIDEAIIELIPSTIKKVGVFVNETEDKVKKIVRDNKLDLVQLHGDESPDQCAAYKKQVRTVVKAFRVNETFDFSSTLAYMDVCDYFLFDTYTCQYGGSGHKFDWRILTDYHNDKALFLSGGIAVEDAESIKVISGLNLYSVDINSRFEIEPGIKDIAKVKKFIEDIRNES